jgi:hypothetical protein
LPAPDITLRSGQILVLRTDTSTIGVVPYTEKLAIGYIVAVCDTCDYAIVGRTVLFQSELAFGILSGAVYYIVDENTVLFQEPEAP